ncbi:hypothetical protein JCM8097_001506 [Rhodosporidiobolus ruineniae]
MSAASLPRRRPAYRSSSSASSSDDDSLIDEAELLDPRSQAAYPPTLQRRIIARAEYVMHSRGKKSSGSDFHLSKRNRNILIVVVLVLIIAGGAFAYWKWGSEIVADVVDFVTFPTMTTPVDLTSAVMSVVSVATSKVVGAFSTATAAVVGAESTATAAVAGAAETAASGVAQITNIAKVTNLFGGL